MNRRPWTGAGLLALALGAASCGASLQTLPAGPGSPAPDARRAFDQAVAACRRVTSFSAEMAVSGSAGSQRLRGRVLAGLASPAFALLDAAAPFGASLFIYAARDTDATLLLPRDQRVLHHGEAAVVLEAVTGVPLGAADLRRALTGCVADGEPSAGQSLGSDWRVLTIGDDAAYLRRVDGQRWRLVAVVHRPGGAAGWRADYGDFDDDLPRSVRLASADAARRFDVRLRLSQVEVNPLLAAEMFDLKVPPSLTPITLDELRRAGPMAETTR